MSNSKWTIQRTNELIRLFNEGYSQVRIAKELHLTIGSVASKISNLGLRSTQKREHPKALSKLIKERQYSASLKPSKKKKLFKKVVTQSQNTIMFKIRMRLPESFDLEEYLVSMRTRGKEHEAKKALELEHRKQLEERRLNSTILDFPKMNECKFIFGDVKSGKAKWCYEKTVKDSCWCYKHYRDVYQPRPVKGKVVEWNTNQFLLNK